MADAAPTPSLDKAPRDRLELSARPQAATRLNRTVIGGGLAVALVLGSLAVMMSLQTSTPARPPTDAQALGAVTLPEGMRDGPHGYGYLKKPVVHVAQTGTPADAPPPVATPPASPQGPSPEEQARDAARKSGLFFPRAAPAPTGPAEAVPPAPLPPRRQEGTHLDDDPPVRRLPPIVPDQAEKRAFLRTAGSEATALKGRLQSPRSPYEIKAGHHSQRVADGHQQRLAWGTPGAGPRTRLRHREWAVPPAAAGEYARGDV